ncbi:MAG: type I methionyl aminopeptidase [Candidatus Falkowbacteria bacterium]
MIRIKSNNEIALLREGGKRLASVLRTVAAKVADGAGTVDLENLACALIEQAGGRPSFKLYRPSSDSQPFPTALCISINNQVVHGPATPNRIIKNGDIVSIDVGMEYPAKNGLFTDMATTVAVGKVSKEARTLIKVTQKSLELMIKKVRADVTLFDLGKTVEDYVESYGFAVVRDLVGHGVGYGVHEEPQIPNFAQASSKQIILKPGMVIALEPMVNLGSFRIVTDRDGFTIRTADNSLSAHFEHTIAVTEHGYIILTA